jgi:hypothetical protein
MRYESKKALIEDICKEHDALCELLLRIPESRHKEPGVWGNGWNICDLVSHLAEWQRMFLNWYGEGLKGSRPQMPAPGFRWNEIPRLNHLMWEKYRTRSPKEARADFDRGYRGILRLVEDLAPERLLRPGHFEWTGENSLATYLGPNTASHYRFAIRVIKRWQRRAESAEKRPRMRLKKTRAAGSLKRSNRRHHRS